MLPDGWRTDILGNIAEINWGDTSKTKSSYVDEGFLAYSAAGGDGFLPFYHFDEEGIILSAIGANCGYCFRAFGKWSAIKNTIVITKREPNGAEIPFLYYILNNPSAWVISGGAQPFIGLTNARKISITLPPRPEQKRIAEVLSSVDAAIEATKAVIDQTKTVKQGLLQTLLTRGIGHTKFKDSPLGEIPESWEVKTFDAVCSKITDGTHFSPPTCSEGFLYITSKNIRPLRMDLSNPVYVSEEEHNKIYPRCDVKKGDVLLTKDGAKTGNCAINSIDEPFSMLSSVALIRADNNITSSNFICQFLNSPIGIKQSVGSMSGQAITRITLKKIKDFLIPVPPLEEQGKIVDLLLTVDTLEDNETEKLSTLQTLKKGLMNDLLTGKVRVDLTADTGTAPISNVVPFVLTAPVDAVRKHAVLSAEITAQLHLMNTFGATKREKLTDLVVRHVGLDETTDRQASRHAAGSYDPKARREIDDIFEQEHWFAIHKDDQSVRFMKDTAFGGHKTEFEQYFGSVKDKIQKVIKLLRDYDTRHCEIVDTLYTAWNDFLIEGKSPSDDEIITEVLTQWNDSKLRISKPDWQNGLAWMRRHDFLPSGRGRSTKPPSFL